MNELIKMMSIGLFAVSVSSQAQDITVTTDEGFELAASYYQSNTTSNRGVLLLHQCNYNRTMYNEIGQQLSNRGIHALSLDFRGYGDSAKGKFTQAKVEALPREEQTKVLQEMYAHWPQDVQLAYDTLKSKMPKESIVGVVGASCGGSQAITLAKNNSVNAIAFFSSAQRKENITHYKNNLADKPTLIIASEKDTRTYESAQQLFTASTNMSSKLISYKGSEHGYPLLDSDTMLGSNIVNWLDNHLVK
ncbi:serine aminopeptidase domain-containing protein [Psychrobium sp. 1_MG-2023]|uniref:serine aminopeptidase domain-containing protein n=1 Tax=Psychrobium sp. 1_MG-2023 TaxID=3062624 RepID=UPI000C338F71|nr:alpha/beta hydrolase [Psychrobium sp. 1_MG-2023]MDP2562334.1 alpha/beta hydrolase [Psychrobium sp. 1_MG-2023]PKF58056.1 alpha/beta hydrolase [Alteromonadales bacterium alter-6D02]